MKEFAGNASEASDYLDTLTYAIDHLEHHLRIAEKIRYFAERIAVGETSPKMPKEFIELVKTICSTREGYEWIMREDSIPHALEELKVLYNEELPLVDRVSNNRMIQLEILYQVPNCN